MSWMLTYWPVALMVWMFGAALVVGFFRAAASSHHEQERHIAEIERENQRIAAPADNQNPLVHGSGGMRV